MPCSHACGHLAQVQWALGLRGLVVFNPRINSDQGGPRGLTLIAGRPKPSPGLPIESRLCGDIEPCGEWKKRERAELLHFTYTDLQSKPPLWWEPYIINTLTRRGP